MKILKLISVILVIIMVLFLGGAILLPSRQYYAVDTIVKNDPVAIFTKLSNQTILRRITPDLSYDGSQTIQIINMNKFDRIQYHIFSTTFQSPMDAGFEIMEVDEGTLVTWYMEKDSLSFPLERWEAYITTITNKNEILKSLERLETEISK